MKKVLSPSHPILVLLALASVHCLSAQTLVIDKSSLSFSGQVGGPVVSPQTINVTSSTGASTNFLVSAPSYPWLKFNGQTSVTGSTPSTVTITADPAGLAAGSYQGSISVAGGTAGNTLIPVTFTVSAIGVNPASLAFTYTVGSSTFPGTQVLTLSGATTQCTATSATASGGSWFSLLNNNCTSPGTVTVLFSTSIIAGLAANTYNGTVTITPAASAGSPAVVVPITLTVLPTPPVTVNPTSLVLIWQTGVGAENPSTTFSISTTAIAAQPLGYSFSQTGVLTSNSTISPSSGTFSAASGAVPITYTVTNASSLAVGTYNGNITLLTPGGSPPQTNIPVTLIVTNTPSLIVPNATLNFTYQLGTNAPASQSVAITATSGNLNYAVSQSANSTWLSVPNAGSTTAPLPVSVNPVGLAAGTYSATVSVVSATPGSSAQQFGVVLKITNDPVISTNISKLTFPYQIGQAAPATQTVRVISTTGVPLNYSASLATTTCGSWLLLNNGTNTVNGSTDADLVVSIATAGLTTAATCDGTITIAATIPSTGGAAVNSPLTIPVKLYVSTTAQLVLAPANLSPFTLGVGSQSAQQSISLTSTNSDVLNYTVAFQPANSWLSLNTAGGSTPGTLTVTTNSTGLAAGQYTGSITITATGPGGAAVADSPVTIPVTLNVTSVSLTLSSTDLTFQQVLGGPAPASQTVTIGSSGQTVLAYSAVANSNNAVNWLSVSPASGNTSANGSLTVSVDGSKLTPGTTYNGTIVLTSSGAGNSPATINVHLKVDPGTLSAPTTTLTFTQLAGGAAPAAQSIAVAGSPAALNFTVTSSTQNGVNWLGASPASGATPANVQVTVNGGSLAVGQYTGTVTITSTGAAGSPVSVPVVLNVVAPGTLAVTPTTLSFAYIIGQTPPVAQNLALSSSAAAAFTTQVQIDGSAGAWLTVSPASGNTPATLVVSVAPTTLAAGNYTGRIVITSPNTLTPVTIPVALTVSAIPKPVVTEVKNAANYFSGGVSPGENVWISGTGLGPATLAGGAVANNIAATTIANTRVLFDGVAAPIIYVSNIQTSVMVPYGVSGRTTTSIVVEYSGVQSDPVIRNVVAAVPGIYTQNAQGTGPGAILNQNGAINSPSLPEKRGNVITVYMTGEGVTNPQGTDGAIIPSDGSGLKKPVATVTATIGGVTADVQYAGSAPGIVSGVMQVNLLIPATAPVGGNVPIVINVGTASSSGAGAPTVAVQ